MTGSYSIENSHTDKQFGTRYPIIDVKEQRRKKDRDRYARMTNEEKQEKLKRRHEAYKQKKTTKDSTQLQKIKCTQGRKKYADLEPEQKTKKCTREKQKYTNMQPEQKKARIEQITALREVRRNTPCKESIAMVNPAYIATEEELIREAMYTKRQLR